MTIGTRMECNDYNPVETWLFTDTPDDTSEVLDTASECRIFNAFHTMTCDTIANALLYKKRGGSLLVIKHPREFVVLWTEDITPEYIFLKAVPYLGRTEQEVSMKTFEFYVFDRNLSHQNIRTCNNTPQFIPAYFNALRVATEIGTLEDIL